MEKKASSPKALQRLLTALSIIPITYHSLPGSAVWACLQRLSLTVWPQPAPTCQGPCCLQGVSFFSLHPWLACSPLSDLHSNVCSWERLLHPDPASPSFLGHCPDLLLPSTYHSLKSCCYLAFVFLLSISTFRIELLDVKDFACLVHSGVLMTQRKPSTSEVLR